MDVTPLFKACVKTIRTRNKAFGDHGEGDKCGDKSRNILPKRALKSDFALRAKEVLGQISRLKDLLLEHRTAYLNFAAHLSDTPQMSDAERDKIDSGAQQIMTTCSHLIQDFKREFQKFEGPLQPLEHRKAVLDSMEAYLKGVCKIYSEQRVIRVKRSMEMQKISKLEFDPRYSQQSESPRIGLRTDSNTNGEESVKPQPPIRQANEIESSQRADDFLSAEEMQLFESENNQLYNEMNSLTEEVKQIESKVVHIAELQEIFTEKVLQQETDIDRIASTVVGTTENVKDANEQIRQAIQRNAGLRVWVLFFLLIMSFSLLFLDWYND